MSVISSSPIYNSDNIPSYLIGEQLDNHVFYYKGYRAVLQGEKTLEEIMGSSVLQFMIIQHLISCIALFDPLVVNV